MALFSQEKRNMRMVSALGKNVLLVEAINGNEGMSRLFNYELSLVSENQGIVFQDILGTNVTVSIDLSWGRKRFFNGIVSRFAQTNGGGTAGDDTRVSHYRATVVPWFWLLSRSAESRIYQNMSVPDIVEKIFKDIPQLLNLEAMQHVANHRMVLVRGCEAGKETTVEKLVVNVIKAYEPIVSRGFCVGFGCITSEPGQNEDVRIMFRHLKLAEFEGHFETHTVATPMVSRKAEDAESASLKIKGGHITVLLNEARTAAGLNGQLVAIASTVPGEGASVDYYWNFPGVPGNSFAPSVELTLRGSLDRKDEVEATFTTMLSSLATVPSAK
jgi:hypothetical protein